MGRFVVSTVKEQQEMLESIGKKSFDDLFSGIPEEVKLKDGLDLPEGLSEMEAGRKIEEIAAKNTVFKSIFRGAGAYDHYIPAAVKRIASKEEFVTA